MSPSSSPGTDTAAAVPSRPDTTRVETPATPRGRVAPDTHPVELRRLAMEEAAHPAVDPLSVQVVLWVLRAASAVLTAQTESLRAAELSTSAFNVLMALRNTPGNVLEPCDIANRLLVTRPSVTGLLDTLEQKGLVERRAHPADRRRRLVHLNPAAHQLLTEHLGDHYAEMERILAGLDPDERARMVTLLRRVEGAVPPDLRGTDGDGVRAPASGPAAS